MEILFSLAHAGVRKRKRKSERMEENSNRIRQIVIVAVTMAAVILLSFAMYKANPIDFNMYDSSSQKYCKGVVTKVNDEDLTDAENMPGWKTGNQNVTVKIRNGEFKGKEVTFDNNLSSTHSVLVKKGTHVIVNVDAPEGIEPYFTIYQYDRTTGIIGVMLIFLALMALVGRWKGVRAALGLLSAAILIAFVLIPAIYNGKPPVLMTLLVCALITIVSLMFLNGPNPKTFAATLSTIIGLSLSAAFYGIFSLVLHMTGYNTPEAEDLQMISSATDLSIKSIMFCGILISSLGALMDIAMDIVSPLYEMKKHKPEITLREMFNSGMSMGRDMIGTLCQTLILAFAGSSLATLLVVVSYGTQFYQFICSDMMMVELLQSMTGSAAVVIAVPVSALLSCLFFGRNSKAETVPASGNAKGVKKKSAKKK